MQLKDKKVGFAVTGSHCTLKETFEQVNVLIQSGAKVYPIISPAVDSEDTRFGKASEWKMFLRDITGHEVIKSVVEAEPVGPNKLFDIIVVAPCTGNTIAKLANGITDTAVLMAVKAHLRNQRPVVLAISTNDGLGINAKNIGMLLNMKNIYMVPFGQDNPTAKANSLVAKMSLLEQTVIEALQGRQLQPVILQYT
ncbi:MAG: dipicolinate synthase subunit B [Thermincola sp.]|jgi:dipicolinate synthase subunit B|nr:dipicolinate synthase subunit B [Thermincola sp.]MDT3701710.1 dipicolinate synthase subunit B [Thermincola sp.]